MKRTPLFANPYSRIAMNGNSSPPKYPKLENGESDHMNKTENDTVNSEDEDEETFEEPQMQLFEQDIKCLFCSHTFSCPLKLFDHCKIEHDFDIFYLEGFEKSFINYVKLINFARKNVDSLCKNGKVVSAVLELFKKVENDDSLMKPVVEDDPLLCFDFEEYVTTLQFPEREELMDTNAVVVNGKHQIFDDEERDILLGYDKEKLIGEVVRLKRELKATEDLLHESDLKLKWTSELVRNLTDDDSGCLDVEMSSASKGSGKVGAGADDPDCGYFDSYDSLSIHEEMIQDSVRTSSYHDFIKKNSDLFSDRTIVDLGCGTGILSLFAASAGARKILAIDQSNIAKLARKVVAENNYASIIKVINDKAENVDFAGMDLQIDVIISEWMGYFLLYECMLDSVIALRDKIKSINNYSPQIYPRYYSMWICALEDNSMYNKHTKFWTNVYGFEMNSIQEMVANNALVTEVRGERVCSKSLCINAIDALTATIEYTDFEKEFYLELERDATVHAICGYFDTNFNHKTEENTAGSEECKPEVSFSTGPKATMTHWKQTVFVLRQPITVKKGAHLAGSINVRRDAQDPRSVKVTIKTEKEDTEFCLK